MNRLRVQAQVAMEKARTPEKFCPVGRCLYRTGGFYCPRHAHLEPGVRTHPDEDVEKFNNGRRDGKTEPEYDFEEPLNQPGTKDVAW